MNMKSQGEPVVIRLARSPQDVLKVMVVRGIDHFLMLRGPS